MPPKIYDKLKRLYLIINRLRTKPQTKAQLKAYLASHDIWIEDATFERDKKELRVEFGVDLIYDASLKAYSIDFNQNEEVKDLLYFLELNQLSQSLKQSFQNSKNSLSYIDFENKNQLEGVAFIDRILKAIKEHKYLEFYHQRFETDKPILYKVKPILLKEYQSRWYVVSAYKSNFKLFGLDRVSDLKILEEQFEPIKEDVKSKFKTCVGVSNFYNQPEYVVLKFEVSQKPYLDKLPLHSSQELIAETDDYVTYEYHVIVNYEFKQHILKYANGVEVIQPKSLRNEIKNYLEKAVLNYS